MESKANEKQIILEKWNTLQKVPAKKLQNFDWLVDLKNWSAGVYRTENEFEIVLHNGLVARTYRLFPNGATIGYDNLMTGESLLRAIKPEASITLNGLEFNLGGLDGQSELAYLQHEWINDFKANPDSFYLVDFNVKPIKARFPWKRVRNCENRLWPPNGVELEMEYHSPKNIIPELTGVVVKIHYECYDDIPLFSKWITIENHSQNLVRLNHYKNEILALVEFDSETHGPKAKEGILEYPHISFDYNYSFIRVLEGNYNKICHWNIDPDFSSQVAFLSDSRNIMESYLEIGPEIDILPFVPKTQTDDLSRFEGFREYQLVHSSYDRQRRSLARCQMYRILAPWITENPIMMHLTSLDPTIVRNAVKQIEEVGFEMLIFSFGSNFNQSVLELGIHHPEWIEDMIEEVKEETIDVIKSRSIEVGGYSLLASRSISQKDDVINPYTGKTNKISHENMEEGIEAIQGLDKITANIPGIPTFGNSPCLGSNWAEKYFQSLKQMIERLDLNVLEHDGSYPGDVCASLDHPGHRDLGDSQWTQWIKIRDFYHWCRDHGVFLNVPDWYMLVGSNKTGIGYKEINWSLPRDRQVLLGRQNIYDGTWEKPPTMGWTFCPLTSYHSIPEYPREVATLEPLKDHLDHYEAHLAQNFGCGVQACYRGFRLFDSEETRELVKRYVSWYKKYRSILDSDLVHIRRPDGRNIDGVLHVNPKLEIKGFALFFNPTNHTKKEVLSIPLYYTGLKETAIVSERDKNPAIFSLARKSYTWYTFVDSK